MGERISRVDLRPAYKTGRQLCVNHARNSIKSGRSPDGIVFKPLVMPRAIKSANLPLRKDGALFASLGGKSPYEINLVTFNYFEYGTRLVYANLMNNGGTIRPTKSKALAIPVTRMAELAGSPRRFPKKLTCIWKKGADHGRLVATELQGRAKKPVLVTHYLLKKSVTIEARPVLTVTQEMLTQVYDVVTDHIIEKAL